MKTNRPSLQKYQIERVWNYPDKGIQYHLLGFIRAVSESAALQRAQRILPKATLRITPVI